jgi:hypothetical protein
VRTIWKFLLFTFALLGFVAYVMLRPEKKRGRHHHE